MRKRIFKAHGNTKITLDNNIITLDIEGPCNTEFFEEMAEQLKLLRPQLNLNNYTSLVIIRGEALGTPEAMSYFSNYLKTVQVRAVAVNLQHSLTPSLSKETIQKAYIDAGVKHRFFIDNISANTWLRECMSFVE